MGLMGSSIAACLLAAGYSVAAVEGDAVKRRKAARRVLSHLEGLKREGLLRFDPKKLLTKLTVCGDYAALGQSQIVIESVIEDLDVKKRVIRNIEQVVSSKTLIGSNTSAIPPTELQKGALHPERIVGIHWGEPAHVLRFMEIIAGKTTKPVFVRKRAEPCPQRCPWLPYQSSDVCDDARSVPFGGVGCRLDRRCGPVVAQ
jgi:3-hydroxybutyryl-CoA dehydrogenase